MIQGRRDKVDISLTPECMQCVDLLNGDVVPAQKAICLYHDVVIIFLLFRYDNCVFVSNLHLDTEFDSVYPVDTLADLRYMKTLSQVMQMIDLSVKHYCKRIQNGEIN